jgi:hypothetical protein
VFAVWHPTRQEIVTQIGFGSMDSEFMPSLPFSRVTIVEILRRKTRWQNSLKDARSGRLQPVGGELLN